MSQKTLDNFFLSFLILAVPLALHASELVNINTASLAELETLPGVGPSIAQSIIDNRPYAAIEEVSRASGIGEPGSSSYEKIKNLITVGGAVAVQTTATATSSTQVQTQAQSRTQTAGAGPPALTVDIAADARPMAGGGSYFSAVAYGSENAPLPGVRFIWNFGDGVVAEGTRVFHTFAYPGRYAVSVTAAYNHSAGIGRVVVEAVSAAVSLEAPGDGSLLIRNKSSQEINIGLWSLVDDGKSYIIPEDTFILAGEGVRFAAAITGLEGTRSATLLYPNSMPAAAAVVSANSPLRGERIPKQTAAAPGVAVQEEQQGEVLGADTSAPAPATGKASSSLWLSLGALTALLAGGAGAVHYLGASAKRPETPAADDEFDIEE